MVVLTAQDVLESRGQRSCWHIVRPQCERKHFRKPFDQINGSYESSEFRQRCVCVAERSREEFAGR